MTTPDQPVTLTDLLLALEKTDNLRALARECGLTTGDLKRRLRQWRRELATDASSGGQRPASPKAERTPRRAAAGAAGAATDVTDLPEAAGLGRSPLPRAGSPVLEIWTDGASRGNPGPAAVGIVFVQKGGPPLCRHAETIGKTTNNVAEYRAVLRALELATGWGVTRVSLNLDSELVARQLTGQYRVKSQDLLPFYRQVMDLARELEVFTVRHVRRERNVMADRLANLALDAG